MYRDTELFFFLCVYLRMHIVKPTEGIPTHVAVTFSVDVYMHLFPYLFNDRADVFSYSPVFRFDTTYSLVRLTVVLSCFKVVQTTAQRIVFVRC